jgi:DNA-cytosine methyltransferase
MEKMKALSLFSGIGGIDLALNKYAETIAFCEQNEYCKKVLNKNFPGIPIFNDVKKIDKDVLLSYGKIDLIHGGFPCQDISVVGNGKGLAGKRSGLFYEICRIAKEVRPTFIFLENVPAIRTRGLKKVAEEFIKLRYDCRWTLLSAKEMGGPHERKRWFLLAYNSEKKRKSNSFNEFQKTLIELPNNKTIYDDKSKIFNPYSSSIRMRKNRNGAVSMATRLVKPASGYIDVKNAQRILGQKEKNIFITWNKTFTDWIGVDDGVSVELDSNFWRVKKDFLHRQERLHALGNSVVPCAVKKAFEILIGIKNDN